MECGQRIYGSSVAVGRQGVASSSRRCSRLVPIMASGSHCQGFSRESFWTRLMLLGQENSPRESNYGPSAGDISVKPENTPSPFGRAIPAARSFPAFVPGVSPPPCEAAGYGESAGGTVRLYSESAVISGRESGLAVPERTVLVCGAPLSPIGQGVFRSLLSRGFRRPVPSTARRLWS